MNPSPAALASFVADLHVHSPYAFACSKALTLDNLAAWARRKGIDLLATGDFTHPAWTKELRDNLIAGAERALRIRRRPLCAGDGNQFACTARADGCGASTC